MSKKLMMKNKKLLIGISAVVALAIAGVSSLMLFKRSVPEEPFSIEFCDPIKLEAAKTQFCLDKRLIKDYEVQYIDRRTQKINQANELHVYIQTRDYKETGELIPGSSSWRTFRVVSGVAIIFTINFDSRFKNFDELVRGYSEPFYEPHNEFPPRKGGKVGQVNNLDYIYELKVNDPDSMSKGIEIDTNFLNEGKEYNLSISASLKSINKNDFMLLHDNILKTMQFTMESNDVTITTDKIEYDQGETLKITLKNDLENVIITRRNDFIERKISGESWEEMSLFSPDCVWDMEAVIEEIEAGKSRMFEWKPAIYGCSETTNLEPGLYRLLRDYQIGNPLREAWDWKTIRSNEFSIK